MIVGHWLARAVQFDLGPFFEAPRRRRDLSATPAATENRHTRRTLRPDKTLPLAMPVWPLHFWPDRRHAAETADERNRSIRLRQTARRHGRPRATGRYVRPQLITTALVSANSYLDKSGIQGELKNGALVVSSVDPESPASFGGLKKGDRITQVAHKSVADLDQKEAHGAIGRRRQHFYQSVSGHE